MKHNILLYLLLVIIITIPCSAQDKDSTRAAFGWHNEMTGSLNLTQNSFDNWVQGGENAMAWQLNLHFKFVNDQENINWSNSGKLSYGSIKTGDKEYRKSIDEIKLETVFAYKLKTIISPYVAVNAESQFGPGFDYSGDAAVRISAFMDPGFFRESVGISFNKSETVKTRLGASCKQTITSDHPAPFADDPSTAEIETLRKEIGAESVTDVNWKISEKLLLTSKLELFSTLKTAEEIDVNWDNVLTAPITKYFNVNFNFKLFYDKNISSRRQIKQTLAVGLSYVFL